MVCPNCKSTDIITVQDQRFCIACGQILPLEDPATKPTVTAAKAISSTAPTIKRRKPGRPKAARLDEPTAASESAAEAPAAETAAAAPATAIAVSAVTPVLPPAPAVARRSIPRAAPTPGRQFSDITPAKPAAATKPVDSAKPANPGKPAASAKVAAPSKPTVEHLEYGAIESASLQGRFRPAVFHWSLIPATLLAVLAGATAWVLAGHRAAEAAAIAQRAGWTLWGELILILLLFYVSRSIGAAATIFGAARRADHRPTPAARQFSASINSLGARIGFDVVTGVLQVVVIGLMAAVVVMGGTVWPVPELAQIASLFFVYLILAYLLVGLGIIQGLGHVALTLGKFSIWRSLAIGWGFFRRHFELVGFKIVSLILELILAAPLLAALVALWLYAPSSLRWLVAVGAVVLTMVGGTLYGAGTAVWWQAVYRGLVRRGQPGQAMVMLAGRKPEQLQRPAAVLAISLIVLLAGLATAWPWLPLG